ncbi:MAG TPA: hypothetical protein VFJ86_15830, partial [Usitatibacter sp.]|nr:hypothetical protein [Usitatibacter sp.]
MAATHQAPFAFSAAQAFLKSIEPAFGELEARIRKRNAGGDDAIADNPGELAPIVSGIAFAIELFL